MRVIDLDAKIIVPIVDETQGGMVYEAQMTVAELFARFLPDYTPEVVDAIPVEWLNEMKRLAANYGDNECMCVIEYLLDRWQKEQEARQ